ncbi:patatin-like phospholipase family protein [Glaesserella sp.]|uniref:patatin-like phospholipase family protein n=1 Tax=Glaesserella sp. TaxID=2094731 RepID=UPI0035A13D41
MLKTISILLTTVLLSACNAMLYQPTETISEVTPNKGYRMKTALAESNDGNLIVLMFSGGGSRAAALGYGVLEQFKQVKINHPTKPTLLDNIDIVFGVSGGSILAAYLSMEGKDTVPKFEENFLKRDFESQLTDQLFSLSNLPRLTSDQFGRGDLLQEQLNLTLYGGKKFGDLSVRKGPLVVISATDMSMGQKVTFTQEFFDGLCLNLDDVEIARAVAASSAVPLVFSPITFNNNGGNCGFVLPEVEQITSLVQLDSLRSKSVQEMRQNFSLYQNSKQRPFIHLVDGGLTDNLGLASLTDIYDAVGQQSIYQRVLQSGIKRIVVINVNAQNEVTSEIDQSANIPRTLDVLNTIVNVPIDRNTQVTLRRFREFTDEWNQAMQKQPKHKRVDMHFVSLNLKDLPESTLKKDVLNISTSFYLPKSSVNKLKKAAQLLLQQSSEYRDMLKALQ